MIDGYRYLRSGHIAGARALGLGWTLHYDEGGIRAVNGQTTSLKQTVNN